MTINIKNTVNTVIVLPAVAQYLFEHFPEIPVVSFKDPLEMIHDNKLFFSNDTLERAEWLTLPIVKMLAHLNVKGQLKFEYTDENSTIDWGYSFDGRGKYTLIKEKPDFKTLINVTNYVYDKEEISLFSLHGSESDVITEIKDQILRLKKAYPGAKDIRFDPNDQGVDFKLYMRFMRPENEQEKKIRIQQAQNEQLSRLPYKQRMIKMIDLSMAKHQDNDGTVIASQIDFDYSDKEESNFSTSKYE